MSDQQPFGMGGFLQGMLGDLLKMVKTDQPVQWEMLVQFAQSIAADAQPERNPEPLERIRLEQLVRIVELHVGDVTGLGLAPSGTSLSVLATSRAEWAKRSLESWRSLIERIAQALQPLDTASAALQSGSDEEGEGFEALLLRWANVISPLMLSMQIGSVVGHLARRALGEYELLLPRPAHGELMVVTQNLRGFADDWSLSPDDLSLWAFAFDATVNAVLARPHVAQRLSDLLVAHAAGFRTDFSALEQHLGDFSGADLNDLDGLTRLLGNPAALSEVTETPELRRVKDELQTLSSTINGYAEWVTSTVAARVSGDPSRIKEALRRHRVERGDEARTADQLFGLTTDQHTLDRGEAFIRGVLARDGEHELVRMWVNEKELPTPAEIDAPGLWLERINLETDD